MLLIQNIRDAFKAARLQRDAGLVAILSPLVNDIEMRAKNDGGREVTDADVVKVLNNFISGQQTMLEAATTMDDKERIEAAKAEIALYQKFLPAAKEQLSPEVLLQKIKTIIQGRLESEGGVKPKMGVVISDLKTLHEGEYDPKVAAQVVKDELALIPEPVKK